MIEFSPGHAPREATAAPLGRQPRRGPRTAGGWGLLLSAGLLAGCDGARTTPATRPASTPTAVAYPALTPRELVARALAARGGAVQVARLKRLRMKYSGTMNFGPRPVPFQAEAWQDLPERLRIQVVLTPGERPLTSTQILAGPRGWRIHDQGRVDELTAAETLAVRGEAFPAQLASLHPLLEPGIELAPLPDQRVGGVACAGLKVAAPDMPVVELYFDRATWLPAKWVCTVQTPEAGRQLEEVHLDRWEERSGLLFPLRMVSFRDRNQFMEALLTEVELLEAVPDSLFQPPSNPK